MSLILKGFVIGIGKIIPGVSGSLIAISLGIYEKCILMISDFFKNKRDNILYLGKIGIGILLAIVIFSKLIMILLDSFYFPTMLLFIGLIIGTVPTIKKEIKIKKRKDYLYALLGFLIIILIYILDFNKEYIPNNTNTDLFIIFILGIIEAATMIIPGISGTAVFILIGCYEFLLTMFSNINKNLLYLMFFFLGVFVGIISISKILNYLFKNKKDEIYLFIFGISFGTIYILFVRTIVNYNNVYELLIGIILLFFGYNISKKLGT